VTGLRETAGAVAEGIGALHHLTLGPGDELEGPDDVADVLASMALAMSRMPRLLGQLAAFLEVEHVKGTIGPGRRAGTGEERVRAVSDALHRAGLDAETMALALDAARQSCAELAAAASRGGEGG
jgi:hypothetical protein